MPCAASTTCARPGTPRLRARAGSPRRPRRPRPPASSTAPCAGLRSRRWPGSRSRVCESSCSRRDVTIRGASVMAITSLPASPGRLGPRCRGGGGVAPRPRMPPPSPARALGLARAAAWRSAPIVASSTRRPPSRRTRTSVPWPGHVVGQASGAQVVDEAVEGLGRHVAEEAVVDLQARGPPAVGDALGVLEREHAVGRGRPGADAEGALGVLEQLVGAAQHAGDVGAHRDHVAARRARCATSRRTTPCPATSAGVIPTSSAISVDGLGAQPAVLLLGQVAERDQRRARVGVQGHQLPRPRRRPRARGARRPSALTGPPRP